VEIISLTMSTQLAYSSSKLADFCWEPFTVGLYGPVILRRIHAWGCAAKACLGLDSGGRACNRTAHLRTVYETLQNLAVSERHIERSTGDGGAVGEGALRPKVAGYLACRAKQLTVFRVLCYAPDPAAGDMRTGHV
jgi:hypothetical protein